MRIDFSFAVVLFCFLLSGFAGLLFETVWTRQFGLVFGTSELAVATVLAAYMGGLAAGAAIARRWVLRTRRPLCVYGLLELGIGASALAVPHAIRASTALCVTFFGGRSAPPDAEGLPLSLFYLVCSFVILLVPTSFMGATLPLLARFAVRREEQIGSRVGALYATNTLGAVLGTLFTAFVLLPNLGLGQALWVGVGINAFVFGLASLVAARVEPAAAAQVQPSSPRGLRWRRQDWILPLILISGISSFSYEVLWTRLLGHVLGGTVYAFGTMLASFLAGIAAGSALASRFAKAARAALRLFSLSQVGVAVASLGAFLAVDRLPALALALGAGGQAGLLSNAALAACVLFPGALFIGASFPLAVRVLARGAADASPASARVYAWNTVGAIVGAVGAGFIWIPALAYHGTLAAAAALNLLLAGAAALLAEPPRKRLTAAAAAAAAALLLVHPGPPWRLLTTSALDIMKGGISEVPRSRVKYLAVGRSSTVLLYAMDRGGWILMNNGLPEAGIRASGVPPLDEPVYWLGGLPILARPDARSMLVIGLGGGSTLEGLPASLESIDVIELEFEVLEANRAIAAERALDPLSDPRVHVYLNDARGALQLTSRHYDAIVSQPSHPWTAGASHLFTREFFRLVREHLSSGGVFVQWTSAEFADMALLRSLVATLIDTFPNVRLYWVPGWTDVFLLASEAPLPVEASAAQALAAMPGAFAQLGVYGPEDVAVLRVLDEEDARSFAAGAPISTDSRNRYQFQGPRALREPLGKRHLSALVRRFDPLSPLDPDWDTFRLARRLLDRRQFGRVERLARQLRDPGERDSIEGMLALRRGRGSEGESKLRAVLRADPNAREARVALARQLRRDPLPSFLFSSGEVRPDPELEAVVRGWRSVDAEDWQALAQLDSALAAVAPADALYVDALRLRARWRIETHEPQAGREALALLDTLVLITNDSGDAILRSRASTVAGDVEVALWTLRDYIRSAGPASPVSEHLLDAVSEVLAEIPGEGPHAELRAQVASELIERRFLVRGNLPLGTSGDSQARGSH